jgi:AraC-like DNA-binding protein
MKREGWVSTQLARKIAAAAAVLGADVAALLEAVGLTPAILAAVDDRVPIVTFLALLEEAAQRTADEAFGLHAAELMRRQPDNALAFAAQSSTTLGEAYRRVARYVHLVNDTLEIRIAIEGPRCRLRHLQHAPVERGRHGVECSLAMFVLLGRQMVGPSFRVERVSFRHAQPGSVAEHARLFEAAVAFEEPADEIVFAGSLLDAPVPGSNARAARHLDQLLDEMKAELPREADLAERVRAALAADLRSGPTLERAAARLGTAPRSLQRRLQAEGASFQALLDELRRELSLRYLAEEDLSLADVAFSLGFAEQSAFHRAFRRWMKLTPAEWRRARAGRRPEAAERAGGEG